MIENEKRLVSVIVPAYNSEQYIADCLWSLRNQSYNNIEIVVINDGSTDQTQQIAEQHAKLDKRIILSKIQNSGVSNARNHGLRLAHGHYITFVDSDDTLASNAIELMIDAIGDSDLCVFNYKKTFSAEDCISTAKIAERDTSLDVKDAFVHLLQTGGLYPPFCKILSLEKILQNGLHFDPKLSLGEDVMFNLSYLDCCNRVTISPTAIYNYNTRNSTLSKNIKEDYAEIQLEIYKHKLEFIKSHQINFDLKPFLFPLVKDSFLSLLHIKKQKTKKKAMASFKRNDIIRRYLSNPFSATSLEEIIFKLFCKLVLLRY